METEHRILRNTAMLAGGHILAQLANFGFVIYFARTFGAETFGAYSVAMAVGGLLSGFVSFGTATLATKAISRQNDADVDLFSRLVPFHASTGSFVFAILVLFAWLGPLTQPASGLLVIVGGFQILVIGIHLFAARFDGREMMGYSAFAESGLRVLVLFAGCTVILFTPDPLLAAFSLPVSAALVLVVLAKISNRRFGPIQWDLDVGKSRALVVQAWPYFSVTILGIIYARIGVLLLRVLDTETAVGLFSSAERLIIPVIAVLGTLIAAAFPAISRAGATAHEEMEVLVNRALRLLIVLVLPLATLMFLFSPDIIHVLYGDLFSGSEIVLKIVSWAMVFKLLNMFLSMLCISLDQQAVLSRINFVTLLVYILLATALISKASFIGLSLAFLFTEVLVFTLVFAWLRREPVSLHLLRATWRTVLSCAIAAFLSTSLYQFSLEVRLPLTLVLIAAALVLSGAVRFNDLRYLRKITLAGRNISNTGA
jgi:PST family polysaccharide transporter